MDRKSLHCSWNALRQYPRQYWEQFGRSHTQHSFFKSSSLDFIASRLASSPSQATNYSSTTGALTLGTDTATLGAYTRSLYDTLNYKSRSAAVIFLNRLVGLSISSIQLRARSLIFLGKNLDAIISFRIYFILFSSSVLSPQCDNLLSTNTFTESAISSMNRFYSTTELRSWLPQ